MKFKEYVKEPRDNEGAKFLKLQNGKNVVRIVSEFESYGNHYIPTEKRSHICTGTDTCKYCKEGDKAKIRFLLYVIDRSTPVVEGQVDIKLLDVGYSVFDQISDFAKAEGYGFDVIPNFDITIEKTGVGLTTEYKVIPQRNESELTEEELLAVEALDPVKDILTARREKQDKENGADQINYANIPF